MKTVCVVLGVILAVTCSCSSGSQSKDPWAHVDTIENSLAKYEGMSLIELESVLKELQRKETAALNDKSIALSEYERAQNEHKNADSDNKPDTLIRMLDAKTRYESASITHRELQRELSVAKEAFTRKKTAE